MCSFNGHIHYCWSPLMIKVSLSCRRLLYCWTVWSRRVCVGSRIHACIHACVGSRIHACIQAMTRRDICAQWKPKLVRTAAHRYSQDKIQDIARKCCSFQNSAVDLSVRDHVTICLEQICTVEYYCHVKSFIWKVQHFIFFIVKISCGFFWSNANKMDQPITTNEASPPDA